MKFVHTPPSPRQKNMDNSVAWRCRCGMQNLWSYGTKEEVNAFIKRANVVHFEKQPLYLKSCALNAELVAALQHLVERHNSGGTNGAAMEWAQARAVIAKARDKA